MNSPKTTARGDYICVKGVWEEILRLAQLNVIAAKQGGPDDALLIEWHKESINALSLHIVQAKTQCAVRLATGDWLSCFERAVDRPAQKPQSSSSSERSGSKSCK